MKDIVSLGLLMLFAHPLCARSLRSTIQATRQDIENCLEAQKKLWIALEDIAKHMQENKALQPEASIEIDEEELDIDLD